MKRLIILILALIMFNFTIKGQEVNITSSFDTSRIFIGDQIEFSISVDQPSDLRLDLPFFKDTIIKKIEIISGPSIDSSRMKGRIKIITKYLITSFDSGFYQIPPVFVEMKNEKGLKRFYSDYTQLEVIRVSVAPADTTAKIYDIIKPYRAAVTVGELLPWILIIILCGIIVWSATKFFSKLKRSKTGVEPVTITDPAHIIAFRELEKLREEALWQKGEIKKYYTKLTEILRQYLENRFRVFSLELTTSETLEVLVKTGFKKDATYNLLKSVLTEADLVKFAKYNPEPSENDSIFNHSWSFILATKENEMSGKDSNIKENAGEGRK